MGPDLLPVIEKHNCILRQPGERWHGAEVKFLGDGMMFAFGSSTDALEWCVEVQRELGAAEWPEEVGHLRVRMGVHAGESVGPQTADGATDYLGPHINRAARIASEARGGQVLLSSVVRDLALKMLRPEFQFQEVGTPELKGLAEPVHLYRLLHPQIPPLAPREEAFLLPRHNLPPYLTPVVGREREVEEICSLLRSGLCRLVTLVGPGGVGKTRLAVAVASALLDDFPDQVRFVDLFPLTRIDDAVNAMAAATGLHLQARQAPKEQLLAFLRDRRLLVVLDNLEHLPQASPLVTEILRQSPNVRCLATSRRVLGIAGEHVVEVEPLGVPEAGASFSEAAGTPAIQLFAQLARSRRAKFQVTPENVAHVSEVCRRLQGMPLAMELAASRVRSLSLAELASKLQQGFAVLAQGGPEIAERHRTLHNAVAWSYSLLQSKEQLALGYLSQFSGGFTLEAAEAICQLPDTFDCLAELCDQSLVTSADERDHTRYSMLDHIRDFAAERLPDDERGTFRRRYIDYFAELASDAAKHAYTAEEPEAFLSLDEDLPNLRQAMQWALVLRDAQAVCELANAASPFMHRRGLWQERVQWLTAGAQLLPRAPDLPTQLQSLTFCNLADALYDTGDLEAGQPVVERSLALSEATGDAAGQARACNLLGLIAHRQGDLENAAGYWDCALGVARSSGEDRWTAVCLSNKARLAVNRQDWDAARTLLEEGLALARRVGDETLASIILSNLGAIAEESEDFVSAEKMFKDCLRAELRMQNILGVAVAVNNLGEVAEHVGDPAKAASLISLSCQALSDLGSPHATHCKKTLESLRAAHPHLKCETEAAPGVRKRLLEKARELVA